MHRRLAHVGMSSLKKLMKNDLVRGLKDVKFEKDKLCSSCQAGKQVANTHLEAMICLVDHLCLGPPRNKIVWFCPPPKRNTLPRVLVVHKYFT